MFRISHSVLSDLNSRLVELRLFVEIGLIRIVDDHLPEYRGGRRLRLRLLLLLLINIFYFVDRVRPKDRLLHVTHRGSTSLSIRRLARHYIEETGSLSYAILERAQVVRGARLYVALCTGGSCYCRRRRWGLASHHQIQTILTQDSRA